jgi:L-iditol 2-dehydrogenase
LYHCSGILKFFEPFCILQILKTRVLANCAYCITLLIFDISTHYRTFVVSSYTISMLCSGRKKIPPSSSLLIISVMSGSSGSGSGSGSAAVSVGAWLHGVDDLRVEPYDEMRTKALGPLEVRISVKACGICGSDVHFWKHMRIADFVVEDPMVIGHESAGVVTEVGSGVKDLAPGDRVAMEPGIPCRMCCSCKEGRYNICDEMKFFATPPVHGSLAQYVVHPADFCYKLPGNMSLEEGAMCEPVSVAIHACRRAGVTVGDCVAVLGAGPIGLVTLLVAKAFGAKHVIVTDISESRLQVAKSLGGIPLQVDGKTAREVSELVKVKLAGIAPRISIDCVGFESSMQTAMNTTASGGMVCLVGMGHSEMLLPMTATAAREVDIRGVFRYCNTYHLAVELISTGKIDVKPLITHHFSLAGENFNIENVNAGFNLAASGEKAIKVMFTL